MSLERLIPTPIYKCWEYLQMVQNLFPRGPAWRFPIKPPVEVTAPDWVYLDTYLEQDFTESGALFDVYLDSMFRGDYHITTIGTTQVAAQRNSVKLGYVTPILSNDLVGDFEVEFGLQIPGAISDGEAFRLWFGGLGSSGHNPLITVYTHSFSGLSYLSWDYNSSTDFVYHDFSPYDRIDFRVRRKGGRIRAFYRINGASWIKFIHDWYQSATGNTQLRHDSNRLDGIGWTYMRFQDTESLPNKVKQVEELSPDWVSQATYIEEDYSKVDRFSTFWAVEYPARFTIGSRYGSGTAHTDVAALQTNQVVRGIALKSNFDLEFEIMLKDTGGFFSIHLVQGSSNTPIAQLQWRYSAGGSYLQFDDGFGGNASTVSCPHWDGRIVKLKIFRINGMHIGARADIGEYPYSWVGFGTTQIYSGSDVGIQISNVYDDQRITYLRYQSEGGFPKRIYSPSLAATSIWNEFLTVFACELSRLQEDVRNLLKESVPGLSDDLLVDWERVAGIPDECSSLATTKTQRQQIVHAKITQAKGESTGEFLPLSQQYFIDYAASLNMVITIEVDPGGIPFRTTHKSGGSLQRVTRMPESYKSGTAVARIDGSRLNKLGSLHRWDVTVVSDPDANVNLLKCVFNRIKPAWTEVNFV